MTGDEDASKTTTTGTTANIRMKPAKRTVNDSTFCMYEGTLYKKLNRMLVLILVEIFDTEAFKEKFETTHFNLIKAV